MDTPTWNDEDGECECGCAPPGERYADTTRAIDEIGWMVMGVFGDHGVVPWSYTVGLIERFDHPEFVITGVEPPTGHAVLNAFGFEVKAGRRFDGTGEEVEGVIHVPTRLLTVHPSHWAGERFNQWHGYYEAVGGKPADRLAIQVVWPAVDGAFPTDPGEEHGQVHQPLLHRASVLAN